MEGQAGDRLDDIGGLVLLVVSLVQDDLGAGAGMEKTVPAPVLETAPGPGWNPPLSEEMKILLRVDTEERENVFLP